MKILKNLKINNENKKINASDIALVTNTNKYKTLDNVIDEFKNSTNIVYEKVLEEPASSIVADNLDIIADGGEYEFVLLAKTAENSELEMQINNFDNSYFNIMNYLSDTTDGEHSIQTFGRYVPNTNAIKGWLYLCSSNGYFSVTKGRIWCVDGKTNYHIEHSLALRARHSLSDVRGLIGVNNNNITSLTFKNNINANFDAGTRLIIRKINWR